jgi:enamine deaminase RidA (YjgF/YER057c/UK114 family)
MDRTTLNPETIATPTGYSHVVTVTGGTTVYVAGQVSLDADGDVVGRGDFDAQVAQSFENLRSALAAAGAAPSDVVRTGMYIVDYDPSMLGTLRRVRTEFFGDAAPGTSTLIGVSALAGPDFLFEVDAIAAID